MGSNISIKLQPRTDRAGPSGPAEIASAEGTANNNLLIKPEFFQKFVPKGQEKTHVGLSIKGYFINTKGEPINLPEITFRIRKIGGEDGEVNKELRVALVALNSFVEMHKNLSKERFKTQMEKMDGQMVFFFHEEHQNSLLNPSSKLQKLKNIISRKDVSVDRTWFFVPGMLNPGRAHLMHSFYDENFANEHPLHEHNLKGVDEAVAQLEQSENAEPIDEQPKVSISFHQVPEQEVEIAIEEVLQEPHPEPILAAGNAPLEVVSEVGSVQNSADVIPCHHDQLAMYVKAGKAGIHKALETTFSEVQHPEASKFLDQIAEKLRKLHEKEENLSKEEQEKMKLKRDEAIRNGKAMVDKRLHSA
ncbi:MAG TPA: hypothetical protein PLO43_00950 [Chlamydiales bacterium]|nr:hypothetical protein [Chlamydiales bacterium]